MMQKKISRVLTSVLFVAVAVPSGAAAQSTFLGFADPILIEAGVAPVHVKAMDLDGVNGIDLVVANRGVFGVANSPPSIQTFLSDGLGGYTLGQTFTTPSVSEPRHFVTGFLNDDNLLDLVVADGRGNRILSLIRLPGGGFDQPRPFDVGREVMSVDLGLINADTFLDVVTGNFAYTNGSPNVTPPDDNPISRLLGDGNGLFGLASLFNEGGTDLPTVFLTLVDRDEDGVVDQAVSIQSAFGVGNQSDHFGGVTMTDVNFGAPIEFGGSINIIAQSNSAPVRPTVIRVDDFNNNGFPDLIIAANGMPFLNSIGGNGIFFAFEGAFMLNPPFGGPTFTSTKFIPTPSPRPFDLAIADVNGDQVVDRMGNVLLGNKDIVITHWNAATGQSNDFVGNVDLTVLIDDGSGNNIYDNDIDDVIDGVPFEFTFSVLGPSPTPDMSVSPRFVELVDIDGDGYLDILTTRTRNDERSDDQPNGHIAIFMNLGNAGPPTAFDLTPLVDPNILFQTSPCFTLPDIQFFWEIANSPIAVTYTLEIADDDAFTIMQFMVMGIGDTQFTLTGPDLQGIDIDNTTTHYWRVTATNAAGDTLSTNVFSFTT